MARPERVFTIWWRPGVGPGGASQTRVVANQVSVARYNSGVLCFLRFLDDPPPDHPTDESGGVADLAWAEPVFFVPIECVAAIEQRLNTAGTSHTH